jgi:hypothetical protein
MGSFIFCVWNTVKKKTGIHCFSSTVHVNCTVQWTIQLTWIIFNDTLFKWTVQENCTVHLKIVNNAILLHFSLALCEIYFFYIFLV